MSVLGETGAAVCWVGEQGVRYYAGGRALTRSSALAEAQALKWANTRSRLSVARAMYRLRFPDEDPATLTRQELLGREGSRVKDCYRAQSARTGVPWRGRRYTPGDFTSGDPVNQAVTAAAQCMYGIAHAVVTSLGCSPALGFVHSGHELSFVLDIADLWGGVGAGDEGDSGVAVVLCCTLSTMQLPSGASRPWRLSRSFLRWRSVASPTEMLVQAGAFQCRHQQNPGVLALRVVEVGLQVGDGVPGRPTGQQCVGTPFDRVQTQRLQADPLGGGPGGVREVGKDGAAPASERRIPEGDCHTRWRSGCLGRSIFGAPGIDGVASGAQGMAGPVGDQQPGRLARRAAGLQAAAQGGDEGAQRPHGAAVLGQRPVAVIPSALVGVGRRRTRRRRRRASRRRPRAVVRRSHRRLPLPGAGSRRRPAGSLPVRTAVWMLRAR